MHLQEVDHAVILTRKLSLCGAAARMYSTAGKEKIAMIGSGNVGSALVRILGRNALDKPETFDPKVSMYVHEEMIDGKPLTQIINETNENVKYLKGAKFTPNVVAEPSLEKAVEGATMYLRANRAESLEKQVSELQKKVAEYEEKTQLNGSQPGGNILEFESFDKLPVEKQRVELMKAMQQADDSGVGMFATN